MDRWNNKVAVVTGASAGIGAATAKDLVKAGMIVVGLARRPERVLKLRDELKPQLRNNLHSIKCDVSNEDEVKSAFDRIEKEIGQIHVLINNAGIVRTTELVSPDNTKLIKEVIDTNVMGVLYCTREAYNSMKKHGIDGHVVIINSVAGHYVPIMEKDHPSINIYPATKHAITAMTETYRQEFMKNKTKIKITSISPGMVHTEIFPEGVVDDKFKEKYAMLESEDISNAILYVLGTPPHVQVHELTIKPVGEKF